MEAISFTLAVIGAVFAVVLVVLGVLMPFFVYSISNKAALILEELKEIRQALKK